MSKGWENTLALGMVLMAMLACKALDVWEAREDARYRGCPVCKREQAAQLTLPGMVA